MHHGLKDNQMLKIVKDRYENEQFEEMNKIEETWKKKNIFWVSVRAILSLEKVIRKFRSTTHCIIQQQQQQQRKIIIDNIITIFNVLIWFIGCAHKRNMNSN